LQPLLHDEQCINGSVTFQLELHLQQTFLLLCLKPCKHPKTIELNLNTIKEEDDGMLSHHRLLLIHKKEGHDVVFFFIFSNTKKEAMVTSCHHLFRYNNTTKENDGTLPLSSSSL
jgi:hypothetical protein